MARMGKPWSRARCPDISELSRCASRDDPRRNPRGSLHAPSLTPRRASGTSLVGPYDRLAQVQRPAARPGTEPRWTGSKGTPDLTGFAPSQWVPSRIRISTRSGFHPRRPNYRPSGTSRPTAGPYPQHTTSPPAGPGSRLRLPRADHRVDPLTSPVNEKRDGVGRAW
jgi:hypothetical protein